MSRRPSSTDPMPPQANKSRKISHGKSDSINQASSSTSVAARIVTESGSTVPDTSSAGLASQFSSIPNPALEALSPSVSAFDPQVRFQSEHDPRAATGYLPTPEPESQTSDILASAAQNITIMSDTPVSDIMSPPATSPAAAATANSSASVSAANGPAQASSSTSPTSSTSAQRTSQAQAAPRERIHAASGFRYTRDEDAPGYVWQNKKAQDEASRAWEQITDKDRLVGKRFGDVLMRG